MALTRGQRWRMAFLGLALIVTGLLGAGVLWLVQGGLDNFVRRRLIAELERQTDVRAEIGDLHVHLFSTSAEARRIACFLPGDAQPFFTADRLAAEINLESFWRQAFSLRYLAIDRPVLNLTFDDRGVNLARIRLPERRRTLPAEPDEPLVDEALRSSRVVIRNGTVQVGAATYGVEGQINHFALLGRTLDKRTLRIETGFDAATVTVTAGDGASGRSTKCGCA